MSGTRPFAGVVTAPVLVQHRAMADRVPAPERDRARRDARRELIRALSERRAVTLWACFVVSSHVAGFALLAGNGRLLLAAGVLAFISMVALGAHVEPEPDPGPKGEIARMSWPEFCALEESVEREAERLARSGVAPRAVAPPRLEDVDSFACLVEEALDDLPAFLRSELERNVPVVICDDGADHRAYGLYMGATVARRGWANRIVIFRDTLLRDFGSDPDLLRRQVTMTVRHEMAHHLGAGERAVAELGLSDATRPRSPRPTAARLRLPDVPPRAGARPRPAAARTLAAGVSRAAAERGAPDASGTPRARGVRGSRPAPHPARPPPPPGAMPEARSGCAA